MMNNLVRQLMKAGLAEKEARIYIALVELGKATAYAIAIQAGLKRPTVYLVLEELRHKGLVNKVPHLKNQIYTAKDPEEFIFEQENKLIEARRALAVLSVKYQRKKASAHLFEGVGEISAALEYRRDELAGQEMYAFYGISQKGKKAPQVYYDHASALASQHTLTKAFAPDDESLDKFRRKEKDLRQEVKVLPREDYLPEASIEVAPLYTKIFLHSASQVLVIESKEFSSLIRQVFGLLWRANKEKRDHLK
jgi:sugar-specific transcriptional regulator TrmB